MNPSSDRKVSIYVLIDPRDSAVRYVGSTLNINATVSRHVTQANNKKKILWVAELKAAGLRPKLEVIDTTDAQIRFEVERKWISHYLSIGAKLLNWEYSREYDREQAKLPPAGYTLLLKEFENMWQQYETIPSDLPKLKRERYLLARALEVANQTLKERA